MIRNYYQITYINIKNIKSTITQLAGIQQQLNDEYPNRKQEVMLALFQFYDITPQLITNFSKKHGFWHSAYN
jgi:hypothetical protein